MRLIVKYGLLLLIFGCQSKSELRINDYLSYIGDSKNGLIVSKTINDISMSARILPTAYLAYLDHSDSEMRYDSLKNQYDQSLTFTLKLKPKDVKHGASIMSYGVHDMKEVKERALTMNFDMAEYITLKTDIGEFSPVLTSLENTYDLTSDRTLYIVFENSEKLAKADEFDLVFEDQLFNTGINHFTFQGKNLRNVPDLKVN